MGSEPPRSDVPAGLARRLSEESRARELRRGLRPMRVGVSTAGADERVRTPGGLVRAMRPSDVPVADDLREILGAIPPEALGLIRGRR